MKHIIIPLQLLSVVLLVSSSASGEEAHLMGRILNTQTNRGIENLLVVLIPPTAESKPRRITTTDQDGTFRFDALDSSSYLLQVTAGTYLLYRKEVAVLKENSLTIRLTPADTVPTLKPPAFDTPLDPQLKVMSILSGINKNFPEQSGATREQRISLQNLLWSNGWMPTYNFEGPHAKINAVNISPDQHLLAVVLDDHTVRILKISTGEELTRLKGVRPIRSVRFSHNGKKVITISDNGTLRLWDALQGADLGLRLNHPSALTIAMFNADDSRLITMDSDLQVFVWSASTGEQLYRLPIMKDGDLITAIDYDSQSETLATGHMNGTISLWDGSTGKRKDWRRDFDKPIHDLNFSQDGRLFVEIGEQDIECRVIDVKTNKALGKYYGSAKHVDLQSCISNSDGDLLLLGTSLSELKLWQADDSNEILTLRGHREWRSHIVPVSNPLRLIFWSGNTIRIFPAEWAEIVAEARKHAKPSPSE